MRLTALVLAAALVACGEFGPGSDLPPGAYALESVDGQDLPFVLQDDDEVGLWVLHADTVFVLGGGKAERRRVIELTGSMYQADTVMNDRHETNYRFVDDQLQVGYFDCPPNALCTPIPTGDIIPDGFTLHVWYSQPQGIGFFRRVGSFFR